MSDFGWNYVFLNHILLIIPYAIVLIGCTKLDLSVTEQEEIQTNEVDAVSKKLEAPVYIMWALMFFVGVFIAPLLIGCSFLSEKIIDSTTVAGIVAVCFSVGCMAGGLAFSTLFKVFGNKALSIFLLILAIGIGGSGLSRNIILLCILIFVSGFGFSMTQSMAMTILGIVSPSKKIALTSALLMALFNMGMFLSSIYEEAIGNLTGDALYMPLYIGSICLILFSIGMALKSPLKD